jgi:hypothetical protein
MSHNIVSVYFFLKCFYVGHFLPVFGWCLWLSGGIVLSVWVACLLASTSGVLLWVPFDSTGIGHMGPRIARPDLLFCGCL